MRILSRLIISLTAMMCAVTMAAQISTDEVNAAVSAAREAPKNQGLNLAAGNALKKAGRYREAIPFYLKGNHTANLGLAEVYFNLYDYDRAQEYLDKYLAKRSKAEAAADNSYIPTGANEPMDWTDYLAGRILLGRSMLDRVEKVKIIDSINVPYNDFYRFIKLAGPVGSIQSGELIEKIIKEQWLADNGIDLFSDAAYVSESGDDVIWVGSDADGEKSTMFESVKLVDGNWDKPVQLFDYASIFGESSGSWIDFPFLMSDGVTLYFAADGDNSLGGLDIFISRRDEDGFLQPSNIGMPYNSPANDYLYAIDEVTGTGWWVTDRNGLPDSVTIYTFIPQDLRINYPVDTENLVDFARVSSIKDTWEPDDDFSDICSRIAAIGENKRNIGKDEFEFAMPGGKIYTSLDDFARRQGREAMERYLDARKKYNGNRTRLADLRQSYRGGDTAVASEIKSLESQLESDRRELRRLSNEVVKMEQ